MKRIPWPSRLKITVMILLLTGASLPAQNTEAEKEPLQVSTLHTILIERMLWHPDGSVIATAGWDHTVRLWDLKTKKNVLTLDSIRARVGDLCFDPEGKWIAVATEDELVSIFKLPEGKLIQRLRFPHNITYINRMVTSPGGETLYGVDLQFGIWSWDTRTWKRKDHRSARPGQTRPEKPVILKDITIHPRHEFLALSGHNTGITVFDLKAGKKLTQLAPGIDIDAIALEPGQDTTLLAVHDSILWRYNLANNNLKSLCDLKAASQISKILIHPHESWRVAVVGGNNIWYLDSRTGKLLGKFKHNGFVTSGNAAWSPDGKSLAGQNADNVWILGIADTSIQFQFPIRGPLMEFLTLSPNDRWLAADIGSGALAVWDLQTGKYRVREKHLESIIDGAWTPNGKHLITASEDDALLRWKFPAMKAKKRIYRNPEQNTWKLYKQNILIDELEESAPFSITLAPSGTSIAAAYRDDTVIHFSLKSGEPIPHTEQEVLRSVSEYKIYTETHDAQPIPVFSPRRQAILKARANNFEDEVRVYAFGRQAEEFAWAYYTERIFRGVEPVYGIGEAWIKTGRGYCNDMQFMNQAKILIAAHEENTVSVWDWQKGTRITELLDAHSSVEKLVLNKNETLLFAASNDHEILIYNTSDWRLLATLQITNKGKGWLILTPEGRYDGNKTGLAQLGYRKGLSWKPLPKNSKKHSPGLLPEILSDKMKAK